MFVGCSEIRINVIVKHVQHVGIIWTCSLPGAELLSFSVPWGQKELLGCGLLEVLVPTLTLCQMLPFN